MGREMIVVKNRMNGKLGKLRSHSNFFLVIELRGSFITTNIYLVQCPYGTAGKNCKRCDLHTYADRPGLAACKQCANTEVTEQAGSIRKSQCVPRRKIFLTFYCMLTP